MISHYLLHLKIYLFQYISCVSSISVSTTKVSSSKKPREAQAGDVFTTRLINRKKEEKMMILGNKVIQPWYLELNLLKSHKSYYQIYQASLKCFFTQVPDRSFLNLVIKLYLSLILVGISLRSLVRGVEIYIHKDQFERIFDLPFVGKSYTLDIPLRFRNFKHSTNLNILVINHMEKK